MSTMNVRVPLRMNVAPTILSALGAMPDQRAFNPPPCVITCCMVVMLVRYSGVSLGTTLACILVLMVSKGWVVVTARRPPVIPAIMRGVLEGYPSRAELPFRNSSSTGVTPKYPPVYRPSLMNVGPCMQSNACVQHAEHQNGTHAYGHVNVECKYQYAESRHKHRLQQYNVIACSLLAFTCNQH